MSGRSIGSQRTKQAAPSAQIRMLIDLFSLPTAPRGSIQPTSSAATLAPLWAADALHRANNLAQMASALDSVSGRKALGGSIEAAGVTARALARAYAELGARELAGTVVPCRPLLEAIVTRLVDVFRGDRTIDLVLALADLDLPTEQRRALTLIASELVINALKYAFPEDSAGHLAVSLTKTADGVELIVADTGSGLPTSCMAGSGGALLQKLASLLHGDIRYLSTGDGLSVSVSFTNQSLQQ